ncbi:toll/interleukin-1 receptor domain-containing protein [Rhodococcus erythropolis]|uniref:toll/interleukin-1 receptor domain-containing protein n=1 Tax=Rhodococcus erythropolis TaxID=1833 RepID=UPI004041EA8C
MTTPKRTPKCLISYSHDSEGHRAHVLRLADSLRQNGVDVALDQYIEHEPPRSWPRWMQARIEDSDVVLVVVTPTYTERFWGRTDPTRGKGADWEGVIITGELYHNNDRRVKFIPVITAPEHYGIVPTVLNQTTIHSVETISQQNLIPLLRQIHGVPATIPAPLGTPNFLTTNDEIANAAALLDDNPTEGMRILNQLAGSPNPDTAARAAFTLGTHYYEGHQYSRSVEALLRAVQCGPKTSVFDAAKQELNAVHQQMDAHFGPNSPGAFARKWLGAINSGDFPFAWQAMDKDFRMVLAQDWILANQEHPNISALDREELAAELRRPDPTHELAQHFLFSQFTKLTSFAKTFDDSWGQAEKPRRYGLDFEVVIFTPTDGDILIWEPSSRIEGKTLVIRRRFGEWKIANTFPAVPIPGWPPKHEEITAEGTGFEGLTESDSV